MTVIGAGILWFGWFGFNAGGAGANGTAALALVNTHLAAAAGALTWVARRRLAHQEGHDARRRVGSRRRSRRDHAGGGLRVADGRDRCIGVAAGGVCYGARAREGAARLRRRARCVRRPRRRRRDRRAAHRRVRARRAQQRRTAAACSLLGKQAIGIAAAGAWAAVVTFVLLKVIDLTIGLRVDAETEHDGLDGALHGESAYGTGQRFPRELSPTYAEAISQITVGRSSVKTD